MDKCVWLNCGRFLWPNSIKPLPSDPYDLSAHCCLVKTPQCGVQSSMPMDFVGRSHGLPENPWGGKSMGWEILGKSMDKSRVFGNSDFGKKSRFENKLAVFRKVLKVCGILFPKLWHSLFDAVPSVVVPELISRRSAENIDFLLGPVQY